MMIVIALLFVLNSNSYPVLESSVTYTIPGHEASPEKWSKEKTLNLFVGDEEIDDNNDGEPDYKAVEVGEQNLEVGTYVIDSVELDDYCSLKVRNFLSDNMFDGEQYYEGDTVRIDANDEFSAFNCGSHNGGLNITVTKQKELIEEAKEKTEDTDYEEKLYLDLKAVKKKEYLNAFKYEVNGIEKTLEEYEASEYAGELMDDLMSQVIQNDNYLELVETALSNMNL